MCVSSFLCFNPLRHVTQSFALTERQFSHAAAALQSEAQSEAQNVGHSGNELTSSRAHSTFHFPRNWAVGGARVNDVGDA